MGEPFGKKIVSFLSRVRHDPDNVPTIEKQRLLLLYALLALSLAGGFFNFWFLWSRGSLLSVALQGLFVLGLLVSFVLFWITRKPSGTAIPAGLALCCLMLDIIIHGGGADGLGLLCILPAYPVIYSLVGFGAGNVLILLFYAGVVIRLVLGGFCPPSIFSDPLVVDRMLLLVSLSTFLGLVVNFSIERLVRRLSRLAVEDPQTGLPNRRKTQEVIDRRLVEAERNLSGFAVTGIQVLNDNRIYAMLGGTRGDLVYRELARRLDRWNGHVVVTGRWNTSLFLSVLDTDDFLEIDSICRSLLAKLSAPFIVDGREISVLFTLTVTRYPDDAASGSTLVSNLFSLQDKARTLPGELIFFNQELHKKEEYRYAIAEALFHADLDAELQLCYQPKVRFSDGSCRGAEVLLRWVSPVLGPVSPAEFIPVAEENGLIRKLTRWVIGRVARDLASTAWRDLPVSGRLIQAINLSVHDLKDEDLIPFMLREFERLEMPHSCIEFEITEGVLVDDNPWIKMNLAHLRELGFSIAIDDFGTGYSSLSYLHRLNVQNLKIDQSFVKGMSPESAVRGFAVVDAIILMGQSLGLELTAEGVETEFQASYLRERGCDTAQGWLYSKGIPFEQYIGYALAHPMPVPSS